MQLVAAACCVVDANPDVTKITVVANRRLEFGELAVLREHAMACNSDFAVDGSGTVVVRRSPRVHRMTSKRRRRSAMRRGNEHDGT